MSIFPPDTVPEDSPWEVDADGDHRCARHGIRLWIAPNTQPDHASWGGFAFGSLLECERIHWGIAHTVSDARERAERQVLAETGLAPLPKSERF